MLIGSIIAAAEERVAAVEGVAGVRIDLDVTSDWSPDDMTESGRDKLAAGRAQARLRQAPRLPEVVYSDAAPG